jgi:hypothetical protein
VLGSGEQGGRAAAGDRQRRRTDRAANAELKCCDGSANP